MNYFLADTVGVVCTKSCIYGHVIIAFKLQHILKFFRCRNFTNIMLFTCCRRVILIIIDIDLMVSAELH